MKSKYSLSLLLGVVLAAGVLALVQPIEAQTTQADLSILKFDLPDDDVEVGAR